MSGVRFEVRVQPKARRNNVELVEGLRLKVSVTAAPEGGKANEAVVTLLAKRLGVAKGRIRVLRGHKSRDKVMLIEGVDAGTLREKLQVRALKSEPGE